MYVLNFYNNDAFLFREVVRTYSVSEVDPVADCITYLPYNENKVQKFYLGKFYDCNYTCIITSLEYGNDLMIHLAKGGK